MLFAKQSFSYHISVINIKYITANRTRQRIKDCSKLRAIQCLSYHFFLNSRLNHFFIKKVFYCIMKTLILCTIWLDTVFNDDVIIHDIIGGFYVYKCRANNNQLRLLYTMTKNKLVIVSHYIKKSDEANHNQTYIPHFERAVARMKGMN